MVSANLITLSMVAGENAYTLGESFPVLAWTRQQKVRQSGLGQPIKIEAILVTPKELDGGSTVRVDGHNYRVEFVQRSRINRHQYELSAFKAKVVV